MATAPELEFPDGGGVGDLPNHATSGDEGAGVESRRTDQVPKREAGRSKDVEDDGALDQFGHYLQQEGDLPAPFAVVQYPLLRTADTDKQTWTEATLNLLNNLLGAGLLAMPRAMSQAGLITGILVMVLVAVANRYTLLLVLQMGESTLEAPSYPEIGKNVFGRQGLLAVLVAYLLFTGGILTAYLIAMADIFKQLPVLGNLPRFLLVCMAVATCSPGAFLKSLRHVAILSAVCMVGVCTLVLVLTLVCFGELLSPTLVNPEIDASKNRPNDVDLIRTDPRGLFSAAALFALQFSVQAGGIEVLSSILPTRRGRTAGTGRGPSSSEHSNESPGSSLQHRKGTDQSGDDEEVASIASVEGQSSLPAAEVVSRNAFVIATVLSGIIGAAGYLRFGDKVAGDLLLNFGPEAPVLALMVARVAYGFVITCSFAFLVVPCRFATLDVFRLRRRNEDTVDSALIPDSTFRRATAFILGICSSIAFLVPDLANMLEFVGVWATMALAFIFPCCFLMELQRRQESRPVLSQQNAAPLFLVMFGVMVVLSSVIGQFEAIDSETSVAPSAKMSPGQRATVMNMSAVLINPRLPSKPIS